MVTWLKEKKLFMKLESSIKALEQAQEEIKKIEK
jgi:hypothetical protein